MRAGVSFLLDLFRFGNLTNKGFLREIRVVLELLGDKLKET